MKLTKEDKAMLREEYGKVWRRRDGSIDDKMADYCTKKVSAYIELDGVVVTFDKPHIKTRFCFGEHGYDYDEVGEYCERMSKSEDYFINENMRWFQAANWLNQIDENPYNHVPYLYLGEYSSQTADCRFGYIRGTPTARKSASSPMTKSPSFAKSCRTKWRSSTRGSAPT